MPIEEAIREKIQTLLGQAGTLSEGNINNQCTEAKQRYACSAWLTAAQNVVHLACQQGSVYYSKVARLATEHHGYTIHFAVGECAATLSELLEDAQRGLLTSMADRARAETFDDFLDHAEAYFKENRKNESGAIAGIVFEDTLRRVCRKENITEQGLKLDGLISELTNKGHLTGVQAKRARVCSHVRTKASHAQWTEFELPDVKATIEFTRELIHTKIDK